MRGGRLGTGSTGTGGAGRRRAGLSESGGAASGAGELARGRPECEEDGRLRGPPGRGPSPAPPRLLAPLLHVSTFRASPPRMPNLAHAICRLSSEIGTRTRAECITSLQLPLHRERRGVGGGGRGPGAGGHPATFLPDFLLALLPPSPWWWGLLGAAQGNLEAGPGRSCRETPGSGQGVRPCSGPPGEVGPREARACVQDPSFSWPCPVTLARSRPHPLQSRHLCREQLATQNSGDSPARRCP